ncbi:MAG: type II toxin-antitoxin system PemK/MazF family toxin [Parcubacteria group bacterium]|nr:type II toxin-antitoxin system PemK/MazF family toxin [Parcubacteria group bacterium]
MHKNFDEWNTKKKLTHAINKRPFFHEREIWYCALGVNIGFEQDGKGKDFLRPVIIIKKFNGAVFFGIPLTHTKKKKPFYFSFSFGAHKESVAVLSQLRLIDSGRLSHKIGEISKEDFVPLIQKLKALLP